jgi:hypothetical protein
MRCSELVIDRQHLGRIIGRVILLIAFAFVAGAPRRFARARLAPVRGW